LLPTELAYKEIFAGFKCSRAAIEPKSLRAALETVICPSKGIKEITVSMQAGGRLQRRAAKKNPVKYHTQQAQILCCICLFNSV
jgi:hypothetical protein